jgi:uncharacterized glyoxalase superfamily protein PhnB
MTDAFDVLLAATDPIEPSTRFREGLRRRLVDALADPTPEETTMATVTPYLIVRDAAAMLDFYRDAFGAVEHHRLVGDDGRVGHAELTIGTSRVALADEFPEFDIRGPESRGGATCSFMLDVPDVDAAFARAVEHGATVRTPPADQFHGNRTANVADPAGHQWMLTAKSEDLSDEQYADRAKAGGYAVTAGTEREVPDDHQVKRHRPGDLYYFVMPVADPARAERFYGAVLGWDLRGGHITNISAPPGAVGDYYPVDSGVHLWFVVDDIEAAIATVRELGGTVVEEPSYSDSGWSATCRDDQGTLFCLSVPSDAYTRR